MIPDTRGYYLTCKEKKKQEKDRTALVKEALGQDKFIKKEKLCLWLLQKK